MAGPVFIMFAVAAAFGVFITFVGWRHPPANVYRCLRCGHVFQRRGADGYPADCPACHSEEWSRP